jgi:hypothetical protein
VGDVWQVFSGKVVMQKVWRKRCKKSRINGRNKRETGLAQTLIT